eukprot:Hpha_TRINITY_DN9879_c0_g1::TRINITY_DN9879_c0_g1_i1::g.81634::m.81634
MWKGGAGSRFRLPPTCRRTFFADSKTPPRSFCPPVPKPRVPTKPVPGGRRHPALLRASPPRAARPAPPDGVEEHELRMTVDEQMRESQTQQMQQRIGVANKWATAVESAREYRAPSKDDLVNDGRLAEAAQAADDISNPFRFLWLVIMLAGVMYILQITAERQRGSQQALNRMLEEELRLDRRRQQS